MNGIAVKCKEYNCSLQSNNQRQLCVFIEYLIAKLSKLKVLLFYSPADVITKA